MIIWNPPDRLASLVKMLASCRQRYRCLVDGQNEYLGESLPYGTQAEVLAWIEARYKVLGELYQELKEIQEGRLSQIYVPEVRLLLSLNLINES